MYLILYRCPIVKIETVLLVKREEWSYRVLEADPDLGITRMSFTALGIKEVVWVGEDFLT